MLTKNASTLAPSTQQELGVHLPLDAVPDNALHITDGKTPHTGDFLKGRLREHLSDGELAYIERLVDGERTLADREVLRERGDRPDQCAVLTHGIMLDAITEGDRRFIVGVRVPGDFVDLHGFVLGTIDHSLTALGMAQVVTVPHARLHLLMENQSKLSRALWFATLLDAAIHRKWIQMLGQLDAPRRIANIYCELQTRLDFVGLASLRAVRVPFTQNDLADMCGISAVHANRAVSKLRETGLAEIRRGTLYTSDWDALREYAQFDPAYLYGDGALKLNEGWD